MPRLSNSASMAPTFEPIHVEAFVSPVAVVVDDDPDIPDVIVYMLELAGFVVQVESNSEADLARVIAIQPDVVWLDWKMPRMSGVEVCGTLRATPALSSVAVKPKNPMCCPESMQDPTTTSSSHSARRKWLSTYRMCCWSPQTGGHHLDEVGSYNQYLWIPRFDWRRGVPSCLTQTSSLAVTRRQEGTPMLRVHVDEAACAEHSGERVVAPVDGSCGRSRPLGR
jgi:CheY-like chemotaxis protein